MRISEIRDILDASVLCGQHRLEEDINTAFAGDMMSDVLAWSEALEFLLTGLVNTQVIRTADMMDIGLVLFVRGKLPSQEIIQMAEQRDMVLLATKHRLYTSCGLLYKAGLIV